MEFEGWDEKGFCLNISKSDRKSKNTKLCHLPLETLFFDLLFFWANEKTLSTRHSPLQVPQFQSDRLLFPLEKWAENGKKKKKKLLFHAFFVLIFFLGVVYFHNKRNQNQFNLLPSHSRGPEEKSPFFFCLDDQVTNHLARRPWGCGQPSNMTEGRDCRSNKSHRRECGESL